MALLFRLLIVSVAAGALLYGCAMQPRYEGPESSHFDGVRFYNQLPAEKSMLDVFAFLSTFDLRREAWPQWVDNDTYPPAPGAASGLVATFINHSTVLVQTAGVNILTDPIWGERASPFSFAGPERVRDPGLALSELPPIDVVLVSHDHYDHLDIGTLEKLQTLGRDGPPLIVAGLGNAELFSRHGLENYRELDWWQTLTHRGIEFTFVEVRHRSGRGLTDQMKSLWGGFVIRAPAGQIYFAGDTGYGPHFSEARRRFGNFDLGLLPIGAYRPRSFMAPVHLDPAQAVQAHLDLGARRSIAIHHGTFQLTYESIDEPYAELHAALADASIADGDFRVLGFGEAMAVRAGAAPMQAAAQAVDPRVQATP